MPKDLLSSSKRNILYESLDRASGWAELGISAAVLADFEQADTLTFTTQIGTAAAVEQKFKPDGTQRYRLSVRPSITWYITDEVTLDARFFYKPALDSPRRVGGTRDYRMDANAKLKWKFGSIKPGSDLKTSLVLSYDWHYDSVPPNADAFLATLDVPAGEQLTVTGRSVVEKRHSLVKLQLEVGL